MHKKIIITLLVAPLLFTLAMIVTQLIPNSWVAGNIKKSQEIIRVESIYHDAYHVPQTHWLAGSDGYSDNIFLEQQIADRSSGVIYGAMMPSYDRYWHGYSIFLRPLLVFFDLSHIRQLLVICFIVLLVILAHLIAKHINLATAVIFGIALALVNPPIIMISLQYSNMFLLMLVASIALLLLLAKKRPKHEIFIFFAAIGSLTSFFDLLTTPAITLGIPLLLYVTYRIKNQDRKNLLKDVVLCALIWGGGYIITWFAKWAIGSLILQRNIFQEATQKIAFWSSDSSTITNQGVGVWGVFMEWGGRLIVYWPLLCLASLGLMLALAGRFLSPSQKKSPSLHLSSILALLIPSLIPIAWIILARQHSFNHQWFSYRHLIILIFGFLLIIWYINRAQAGTPYKRIVIDLSRKPIQYLRMLRAKF